MRDLQRIPPIVRLKDRDPQRVGSDSRFFSRVNIPSIVPLKGRVSVHMWRSDLQALRYYKTTDLIRTNDREVHRFRTISSVAFTNKNHELKIRMKINLKFRTKLKPTI